MHHPNKTINGVNASRFRGQRTELGKQKNKVFLPKKYYIVYTLIREKGIWPIVWS